MTRKPSESPPSPDSNIPPRILWLHNNLPWKQFFYVEALFIAAVTVLVAIGAAVIDNVSGGLTAPCTTKPCDDALRLTRQFERASLPTCDGFYEHLCGGGFSKELPRRFQVEHVVSDILRDRARKATVLSSAVNKLSVFFASCRFQLTVHGAFYGLGDQITDVLILLKIRLQDVFESATTDERTLHLVLRLTLLFRIDVGLRLRIFDGRVHLAAADSLRTRLSVGRAELEAILVSALNVTNFVKTSEHQNTSDVGLATEPLAELLAADDVLSTLRRDYAELVLLPPRELFEHIYPKNWSVWYQAMWGLAQTQTQVRFPEPLSLVFAQGLSFMRTFTGFLFDQWTRDTRSLWLLFHAISPALEINALQNTSTDRTEDVAVSFCYRQSVETVYGVALDALIAVDVVKAHEGAYSGVVAMLDLVRSQAIQTAQRLFQGGLLHETLEAIERIKFELLLVPFSPEELRRVDLLYRDLPVRSYDAYYENRLLPVSLLSDDFDLYQRHSRCLKNDVRGVVTPSRELVCVSPRALTEPLYFPGAEAIINLPTLGFLLARPYADVIYEALRTAPAGTEPSRRFTSMTDCLESQVQVLTNITLVRDPRPEALFRHAGALQLAYEVVHNSGGFRTGNEARRVFFERHCWLWCSGYLRGVKSLEGWPLSGKNVCNMAVRNLLAFYRAFRCYPEDYMGSAEICLVFGRAQQANE